AAPSDTNFGSKGALANFITLVRLFDLKFLKECAAGCAGTSNRPRYGHSGRMLSIRVSKCTTPQRHTTRLRWAPPQSEVFCACLLCAKIALGFAEKIAARA